MADLDSASEGLSSYSPASPCFSTNPDFYDLLVNQPPPSILPSEASSALASEVGSALASDSEPLPSSTKATKQTDLHSFFSKMPSDELHVRWQKRKRDNEDRDREEYSKRKQKDEAAKLHKLTTKRANNQVSQKKRRDRLRKEKEELSEAEKDSLVSPLVCTL